MMRNVCTCVCQCFHPTLSSTILSVTSDQKFQQPKYINEENKIKSYRRCMSHKNDAIYYKNLHIAVYTLFLSLSVSTPCCTNSYIFYQIYMRTAHSLLDFFVFSLVNPFSLHIKYSTCLLLNT